MLRLLCKELNLNPAKPKPASKLLNDKWKALPYSEEGSPSAGAGSMMLDMTQGKRFMLMDGNPPLIERGVKGTVGPKTKQGHYTLLLDSGKQCHLGRWVLQDAAKGLLPRLPLVNCTE